MRAQRRAMRLLLRELLGEDAQGQDDDEEEEEEDDDDDDGVSAFALSSTIFAVVTVLVLISILFEKAKDHLEETTPEKMKPILDVLFSEMTVLGFLSVVTYVLTKGGAMEVLSDHVLGDKDLLPELFETVHMILFGIMCVFVVQMVAVISMGNKSERTWEAANAEAMDEDAQRRLRRELNELCKEKPSWVNLSKRHRIHHLVHKLEFASLRSEFISNRQVDPPFDKAPEKEQLPADFAYGKYLTICFASELAHMCEIPVSAWLFIELFLALCYGYAVVVDLNVSAMMVMWLALGYVLMALVFWLRKESLWIRSQWVVPSDVRVDDLSLQYMQARLHLTRRSSLGKAGNGSGSTNGDGKRKRRRSVVRATAKMRAAARLAGTMGKSHTHTTRVDSPPNADGTPSNVTQFLVSHPSPEAEAGHSSSSSSSSSSSAGGREPIDALSGGSGEGLDSDLLGPPPSQTLRLRYTPSTDMRRHYGGEDTSSVASTALSGPDPHQDDEEEDVDGDGKRSQASTAGRHTASTSSLSHTQLPQQQQQDSAASKDSNWVPTQALSPLSPPPMSSSPSAAAPILSPQQSYGSYGTSEAISPFSGNRVALDETEAKCPAPYRPIPTDGGDGSINNDHNEPPPLERGRYEDDWMSNTFMQDVEKIWQKWTMHGEHGQDEYMIDFDHPGWTHCEPPKGRHGVFASYFLGVAPNRQQMLFFMEQHGHSTHIFAMRVVLLMQAIYITIVIYNAVQFFDAATDTLIVIAAIVPLVVIALVFEELCRDLVHVGVIGAMRRQKHVSQVLLEMKTEKTVRYMLLLNDMRMRYLKLQETGGGTAGMALGRQHAVDHHLEGDEHADATHLLSAGQLRNVERAFDRFDEDNSGSLDIEEVAQLLESIGTKLEAEQTQRMFNELDANKDGVVSRQEFVNWYARRVSKIQVSPEECVDSLFSLIDKDNSGNINVSEFKEAIDSLGGDLSVDDISSIVHELDLDGDGEVSREEFLHLLTRYSDMADGLGIQE